MNKLASLRKAIERAVPDLGKNPDKMAIFVEQGIARSTSVTSASFEYQYTAEVLITEYADHVSKIIVAILLWIKLNQAELFQQWINTKGGVDFEAEVLDEKKIDLLIRLPLTERVLVRELESGEVTIEHIGEPALPDPMGEAPGTLQTLYGTHADNESEDLTNDPVA